MVLIVLSLAWVGGLWLGSLLGLPAWSVMLGLVPLPLLFAKEVNRKIVIVASLAVILLATGAVYSHNSLTRDDASTLRYYNDSGVTELKGVVAADPDIRDSSARLILKVDAIQTDGAWREISGAALVFVPRYPAYRYGDVLQITGVPAAPRQLEDFDYKGYLEHQGIYTVVAFPKVNVLDAGKGNAVLAGIYRLRAAMGQKLAEALPEPQASLAQGILLGLRGNIPNDLNTAFSRSGTSHLLAISGYNLTIMAGILLALGVWLFGRRRYLYVWLALAAIWFYTVITGFNPPVVRGAIMATVFLIAEALGRQRSAASALFFTAAVMAGIHPYILGDASFQLSFMAMAGLIFIHPVISSAGKKLIAKAFGEDGWRADLSQAIFDMFSVSIAAIIAVWPLIAYYFGLFSWAGPLATFLLTFIQPFIIVLGILAALGGMAFHGLGLFFGWLLWPFLTYMIAVVRWLGAPSAALKITWINTVFITVYFLILAASILLYERRQKVKSLTSGAAGLIKTGVNFSFGMKGRLKLLVASLAVVAVVVTFTAAAMPDARLRVSFLDVGQGDAVLLQKGSTQILVDGGPGPQAVTAALSKEMPFWDRTIDAVILTHPHQDHLGGLIEVLKRYKVGTVIFAPSDYASPAVEEWRALIIAKGLTVVAADNTRQIKMGDVTIEFLNPPPEPLTGTQSDVDNNSVALAVRDGDVSFLLTGDMMREAEQQLLWHRADITCTVLKAGHHGSDTSSTPEFLSVVNPRAAVVSVGAGNKYNLPDADIIERLGEKVGPASVYRTDLNGTIDFTTNGQRLWVKTEREE